MKLLSQNSLVTDADFQKNFEKLLPYIEILNKVAEDGGYEANESSINLPFDEAHVKEAKLMADKMATGKLKYFIDIGIGGSNLGTKAVYDAMFGAFDTLEPTRAPKMVFLDTNDATFVYKLIELLKHLEDSREVIINAISKSGETLETLANLEIIEESFPELKQRLVITSEKDSSLWDSAEKMGIVNLLSQPKMVGGRFSVFSSVGLFPLFCMGIDIFKLLEGAMEARANGTSKDLDENTAAVSAIALFKNYENGKIIHDTFVFHPELESLGKWYRQLMGESLGKSGKGITPTVSVGSVDLHSVGQLYLGGPKDKSFSLVWSEHEENVKLSKQVMKAIYQSTVENFKEHDIPFVELHLDDTDEKGLGYFLQFKMIEMMFLGKLLEVNTFNQPDVESYKTKAREFIAKK